MAEQLITALGKAGSIYIYGVGIGSAVYGGMISAFGYSSMFISWLCISVISVLALAFYRRKENS